jgi:hypothetical protein
MQSANNTPLGLLWFPSVAGASAASATQEDKAIVREHDAEIHQLCRDTTLALQELRHGVAKVLLDTLEKMDLDVETLVRLLDERPSVVRVLMDGDTDGLTTAIMIEYLERLCECSER